MGAGACRQVCYLGGGYRGMVVASAHAGGWGGVGRDVVVFPPQKVIRFWGGGLGGNGAGLWFHTWGVTGQSCAFIPGGQRGGVVVSYLHSHMIG